ATPHATGGASTRSLSFGIHEGIFRHRRGPHFAQKGTRRTSVAANEVAIPAPANRPSSRSPGNLESSKTQKHNAVVVKPNHRDRQVSSRPGPRRPSPSPLCIEALLRR